MGQACKISSEIGLFAAYKHSERRRQALLLSALYMCRRYGEHQESV